MNKVILDSDLRAKLNGLHEQLELCDETGQPLGQFLPQAVYQELLYTWANAQVTEEELEQARRQPGGRSLAEIWQRLERR